MQVKRYGLDGGNTIPTGVTALCLLFALACQGPAQSTPAASDAQPPQGKGASQMASKELSDGHLPVRTLPPFAGFAVPLGATHEEARSLTLGMMVSKMRPPPDPDVEPRWDPSSVAVWDPTDTIGQDRDYSLRLGDHEHGADPGIVYLVFDDAKAESPGSRKPPRLMAIRYEHACGDAGTVCDAALYDETKKWFATLGPHVEEHSTLLSNGCERRSLCWKSPPGASWSVNVEAVVCSVGNGAFGVSMNDAWAGCSRLADPFLED